MRKMVPVMLMMLALGVSAAAQDAPDWEVFGGYSMMKGDLLSTSNLALGGMSPRLMGMDGPEGYGTSMNEAVITNGFDFAVTRNLNSWVGIKANFSGHYGALDIDTAMTGNYENEYYDETYANTLAISGKADYRRYNVLFGPQFSWNNDSVVRPFAHALFGVSKMTADDVNVRYLDSYIDDYGDGVYSDEDVTTITGSLKGDTNLAMAFGGGIDLKAGKNVSIRLIQAEYAPTYNRIKTDITATNVDYDDGEVWSTDTTRIRSTGASSRLNNLKLSFGVVFNF